MSDVTAGTVTTNPSTAAGKVLLNTLTKDYVLELDQVHGDDEATFVIKTKSTSDPDE